MIGPDTWPWRGTLLTSSIRTDKFMWCGAQTWGLTQPPIWQLDGGSMSPKITPGGGGQLALWWSSTVWLYIFILAQRGRAGTAGQKKKRKRNSPAAIDVGSQISNLLSKLICETVLFLRYNVHGVESRLQPPARMKTYKLRWEQLRGYRRLRTNLSHALQGLLISL